MEASQNVINCILHCFEYTQDFLLYLLNNQQLAVDYAIVIAYDICRNTNICCNKSLIIFTYKSRNNNCLAKNNHQKKKTNNFAVL